MNETADFHAFESDGGGSKFREIKLVLILSISCFMYIALYSYNPADPSWSFSGDKKYILNSAGYLGAMLSDWLFSLFGFIAWVIPTAFLYSCLFMYQHRTPKILSWIVKLLGLFLAVSSACAIANIYMEETFTLMPQGSGGILGSVAMHLIKPEVSLTGAYLVFFSSALCGSIMYTGLPLLRFFRLNLRLVILLIKKIVKGIATVLISIAVGFKAMFNSIAKRRGNYKVENGDDNDYEQGDNIVIVDSPDEPQDFLSPTDAMHMRNQEDYEDNYEDTSDDVYDENEEDYDYEDSSEKDEEENFASQYAKRFEEHGFSEVNEFDEQEVYQEQVLQKPYVAPDKEVLQENDSDNEISANKEELISISQILEKKLLEFSAEVKVVAVHPGPVITRFELELAPGLKVSKISSLSKDLARSLSVISVRIVEVIPGKPVIGLEIPNEHRQMVFLKEVLEADNYVHASSPLTIGLGKNISGIPFSVDLSRMPHLLVAGTTGSGKSVALNAMLLSLLFKSSPKEVRLILIDPKMLELSVYDGIPHLLTPVVTDMKEAANALRWGVKEMERRYALMSSMGVRNLDGYNRKVSEDDALPHIVIIIDELADMMMCVGKKVEELIARISQKARAAGIHLILATQRPSVDVITGLIKANIPARIAFQVSSKIDSRTILDQGGAEQLLGSGDMLYQAAGMGLPVRIHGAFVSDDEVHAVVNQLKENSPPEYIEEVTTTTAISMSDSADSDYDELYDSAVQIVIESKRASISNVQRRLKIGYNRAARLLEKMEEQGIVSPMEANGSREILVSNDFDE